MLAKQTHQTNCLLTDAETWRHSEKLKGAGRLGQFSSVTEHLSSKHEALGLVLKATEATGEKDPRQRCAQAEEFYLYR